MFTTNHSRVASSLALLLAFSLSACDSISSTSDSPNADVEIASDILSSALSETDGGLMATIQDLTADVTESGLSAPRIVRMGARPDWAACQGNYNLNYNEANGVHVVRYRCDRSTPSLELSTVVNHAYAFRTADGQPVPRPWLDWASVDSVRFVGSRSGTVTRRRGENVMRSSSFDQNGTWTLRDLSGLSAGTGSAMLVGRQVQSGHHVHRDSTGGRAERDFVATISTASATIRNSDDGVGYATRGTMDYTVTLTTTPSSGDPQTRTIEGTIDLEGNGRALLRFAGLRTVYRISLVDGASSLVTV